MYYNLVIYDDRSMKIKDFYENQRFSDLYKNLSHMISSPLVTAGLLPEFPELCPFFTPIK